LAVLGWALATPKTRNKKTKNKEDGSFSHKSSFKEGQIMSQQKEINILFVFSK
jgi:hypothetical protein